ncbi:hypothetical protein JST97_29875 [bacterium]|nr:hypothetical protein [bacterium]
MRSAWLALGLALALPTLSPIFWPLLLALCLLRPALAKLALVGLLLLRLSASFPALQGWWECSQDRMLSGVQICPEFITPDHPQVLTVYAPRSSQLTAHWEGNQLPLDCTPLGHGIFRLKVSAARVRPGSAIEVVGNGDGHHRLAMHWLSAKARPAQMCSLPRLGLAAAVSESTDEVFLLNRQARVRRLQCGDGPSCCQFLPGGLWLAVGTRYDQDLELVDVAGGQVVARWPQQQPVEALSLSQDQRWLAVVAGTRVEFRRLPDLRLDGQVELPQPGELSSFAGSSLVVASRRGRALYRVDHSPEGWHLYSAELPLARPALGLCPGENERDLWISSTSAQLNGGHQKGNHYVLNCLLRLNVDRWELHSPRSTESRTAHQGGPGSVSSGCGPEGLIRSGDGRVLLVYSGSHEVAARDPRSDEERRYSLWPVGLWTPRYIADLGEQTWAVSLPSQHTLAWVNQGQVTQQVQLDQLDLADQGEIDFYESTLSGISCQSCHPRADSDYARHDIGGFSAWGTLSCEGLQKTAPYLRTGNYPDLREFHGVALGLYRDYGRNWEADRQRALTAYLNTLLLPDNPRPAALNDLQQGCQLFFQSGCAECHQPPRFTNCASVPNQTLFPGQPVFEWLDVPSLRGVWRSAPYLHDNRAVRLSDLWEKENQADRHGRSRALTPEQRRQLECFLQCL